MRASRALVGTAAVLVAAVVTGSTGSASANALPIPVPALNLPVPLPTPTVTPPGVPLPSVPAPTLPPRPGGVPLPTTPGSGPQPGGGSSGNPSAKNRGGKKFITTKPMIAGRPEAADLLDDESSPALYRASKAFLTADQGIAKIVGHQEALLRAVENAQRVVDDYQVLAKEAATSRGQAAALHDRETAASRQIAGYARSAYRSGGLGVTDSDAATSWQAVATQLADSAARAELRAGGLSGQIANRRQEYEDTPLTTTGPCRRLPTTARSSPDWRRSARPLSRRPVRREPATSGSTRSACWIPAGSVPRSAPCQPSSVHRASPSTARGRSSGPGTARSHHPSACATTRSCITPSCTPAQTSVTTTT